MKASLLLIAAPLVPALTVAADTPLCSRIDYHFAAHLEQTDDERRTLVCEARVDGELNSTLKGWLESHPPVTFTGTGPFVIF